MNYIIVHLKYICQPFHFPFYLIKKKIEWKKIIIKRKTEYFRWFSKNGF